MTLTITVIHDNNAYSVGFLSAWGFSAFMAAVQNRFYERIFLIMGGFHLEWACRRRIEKVASFLENRHIQYIGACHCSGEKARQFF